MHQLLDQFGQQVHLGSTLVYAVKHSTSVSINYGYVYRIEMKRDKTYRLGIIAYSVNWRGNVYMYKTTLSAANFVIVDVPTEVKATMMSAVSQY